MQYKQLIAYKTPGRAGGEKVRESHKLSSLLVALQSRKSQGPQETAGCDLICCTEVGDPREMSGSPHSLTAAETHTSA